MVNWRNIVPYAIFMLIVIVVFSYSSTVSSDIFLWETSSKDEWDEGVPLDISLNANPGDLILKNSPKTIEFHTISYWNFDEGEGQYAIDDSQRRRFWLVESEANWNEGTFDSLSTSVISDSLTMKLSNISIDPNTIALWPMDTGIGQTVTGIPNRDLDGTLGDSIEEDIHDPNWTEDAKVGLHALKFDTENYVEIPDSPEINFRKDDSFVIEIWFKTTMNNEMRIITKRDDMNQPYSGYALGLNGGKVFFYLQDDINQYVLITTPKSYNNGVWHHISAVRNTSKNMVSIHIDGVEVVNATDPTSDLTNQKNLIIGATSDKSNYYFNGNLDILRIANSQMPYNLNIIYNTNGTYLSKIFGSEELVLWKKIRWIQSQISNDTNIDIMTRVSNDTVSWSGWSDPYTNLAGDEILQGISRYIQFKAELTTKVTTETPILRNVKINFETLGYEQEIFVKLENPPTIREGQNVTLKASIKNKIGEPMSGSLITFFVNKVEISSVLSNAEGKASIQINPSRDPLGRQVLLIEAEAGVIKNEETLLVQRAIPEILLKLENQIPFILVIGIFLLVTILYVYLSQPNQGKLKITSHKIFQNKEEILPRNQKNKKKEIQDNWSD